MQIARCLKHRCVNYRREGLSTPGQRSNRRSAALPSPRYRLTHRGRDGRVFGIVAHRRSPDTSPAFGDRRKIEAASSFVSRQDCRPVASSPLPSRCRSADIGAGLQHCTRLGEPAVARKKLREHRRNEVDDIRGRHIPCPATSLKTGRASRNRRRPARTRRGLAASCEHRQRRRWRRPRRSSRASSAGWHDS